MWAIGELIIYTIYFFTGLSCLVFLILALTAKKRCFRIWTALTGLFFGFLLLCFKWQQNSIYKQNQLNQVGIYYLTNYPNCDSCHIELNENMTYKVAHKSQIFENGDWHYESGGDYWITYLNGTKYQLGNGKYAYRDYKLKYSR